MKTSILLLVPFLFLVSSRPSPAAPPGALVRPAGRTGTTVVPDRFLRRWDPITVFFAAEVSPAAPGPEDGPEAHVRLEPDHPVAAEWLDRRTLQLRPVDPWPPLARFTVRVGELAVPLAVMALSPGPRDPPDGAVDLEPVASIAISFLDPVDPDELARRTTIELRPMPGAALDEPVRLEAKDFTVKALERAEASGPHRYELVLAEPIGRGIRARVAIDLSPDRDRSAGESSFAFSTAPPFRAVAMGTGRTQLPLAPGGSLYTREQALRDEGGERKVLVRFSAPLGPVDPGLGRSLVAFDPPVGGLSFAAAGPLLTIRGEFQPERVYRVELDPGGARSLRGDPVEGAAPSRVFVWFPARPDYLKPAVGAAIVERHGPQVLPMEGRGDRTVDLRIHPVDPLDRTFWPFPDSPLVVDEANRPPGPGEEPPPHRESSSRVPSWLLTRHLQGLGAPPVSTLVELPLAAGRGAARFGLDLAPHLAALAGPGRAGTYLVGLRRLDGPAHRSWVRVQVTDLAVAAFEEPEAVRFLVTSLATGSPVAGAAVRVEGPERLGSGAWTWTARYEGTTGPDGVAVWASGRRDGRPDAGRLSVRAGDDLLVLDPAGEGETFEHGAWRTGGRPWLAPREAAPREQALCHLFTERPVYRPGEVVHVAGWLRAWSRGRMEPARGKAFVGVSGPGDRIWRFPVELSPSGGFHVPFHEEDEIPTGTYTAWLEEGTKDESDRTRYASVEFQVEAYRVPSFQVVLDAPAETGLDQPFKASLAATYYAGGPVAGRPVRWQVTQHPLDWAPARREGFFYSSDGRYSRVRGMDSAPRFEAVEASDGTGAAEVTVDPTSELDARARLYTIEATVTGDDEQTVTDTAKVRALPPFVLALAVPRWVDEAERLAARVLAVGPDGAARVGQELTVRLIQRQWHSVLQAGDFAGGEPRYATDVVDRLVEERKAVSAAEPLALEFALPRAGVYVVEVEGRDLLGRSQVVAVDLFAGGKQAVAWPKPPTPVFTVSPDKAEYAPGERASLVVQSPFQKAVGVAVVEAPDGSRYLPFAVEGGAARLELPVEREWMPRVPVHFLLWRGRVAGAGGEGPDLGKPATMASTLSLAVAPVEHRVLVTLENPARARPGTTLPVTIKLAAPDGAPLAGEVALWLVDQAVLALGREQPLDPLASFMPRIESRLAVRESRNLLRGLLPLELLPGGDAGEMSAMPMEDGGILDRATVRKNFKTVPYFEPALAVPASGTLTVQVALPDNLTHFKLRAKAASGKDRFGVGTGSVHVRLPLLVQPGLPRFVRPGDRFPALAIARVVEGEAGAGRAELRAEGATLTGPASVAVAFDPAKPARVEFPLEVPLPPLDAGGRPTRGSVTIRVGAERTADRVSDAFESVLPLVPDRRPRVERELVELAPGGRLELAGFGAEALAGTGRREVLVSGEPALVRMLAALDSLLEYPHGCTEQRLSRSRAYLAMRRLQSMLGRPEGMKELERVLAETLDWLPSAIDGDGLVAFWPGASGHVTLTAWALQFAVEAKEAGFEVDGNLRDRLTRTLTRALRSDYTRLIDGEAFLERCHALAALASAGALDRAYAGELARRARFLGLEGKAAVLRALARGGDRGSRTVRELADSLWEEATFKLHQGAERFAGLKDGVLARSPLVLPSAPAALGAMTRALGLVDATAPRLPLLMDALVALGRGDGWGSTRADAEALAALVEGLTTSPRLGAVALTRDGRREPLALSKAAPLGRVELGETGAAVLTHEQGGTLAVRTTRSFLPARSGADEPAEARGFALTRELTVVEGARPGTVPLATPGVRLELARGDLVEEHVRVVVAEDSHFVAVEIPFAAGIEPMNPRLRTAPAAARPSAPPTRAPSYEIFRDDRAAFYFDELPAGTYDFYVRGRASTKGSFGVPGARAEKMYDMARFGTSPGARVEIAGD